MKKNKLIIWDFDGVILLSDEIRIQGFEVIFKDQPKQLVQQLLDYHETNGGLSRYVKIRFFYENILGKSISEKQVLILAEAFSKVMKEELTNKKLLNSEWLELMSFIGHRHEHHIASGSDQKELQFLCQQLEIDHYFTSINGSPTPKKQLVQQILINTNTSPDSTILIGDAINDFDAATANNIIFYGCRNELLKGKSVYLESLLHLKRYL